jgi:hypothetical protein
MIWYKVAMDAPSNVVLAAVDRARIESRDLFGQDATTVVFVEADCPTCGLALEQFANRGVEVVAVFEDPIELAARSARRRGFAGRVLSEPAPYDLSRSLAVQTVPTTLRIAGDGRVTDRVVGWDRARLGALLGVEFAVATPATKPGCAARWTYDQRVVNAGLDEVEDMFERGWSDGLPVVAPTPERVEAMLAGRDGQASLGLVPPGMGEATLERVAACAVLAGCLPAYFPVVVAAVEAILDDRFNLRGQVVTTSPPGQILVVNGPIRDAIGLNSGMGALGPGWRANMTVGRAVRLVATLTGLGTPGGLDRATLGHAGKIGLCIAEHEAASPWQPLSVERGLPEGVSAVTVFAGDAPLSISDHRSRTPDALAATLAWAAAATWSPNWWPIDATSLFVIGLEHAALFADHGWSKERLRRVIFETPRRRAGDLVGFGEAPPEAKTVDPATLFRKWTREQQVQIIVAGGDAGRFSAVIGPACAMGATVITKEIV